jgi:hypothetical protein
MITNSNAVIMGGHSRRIVELPNQSSKLGSGGYQPANWYCSTGEAFDSLIIVPRRGGDTTYTRSGE